MTIRISYPQFSLEPITEAIGIITSGQVIARKEVLASDLWYVQGAVQGLLLGNPDRQIVGGDSAEIDAELDKLDASLEAAHTQCCAIEYDDQPGAFDPMIIFQIIQMLLPLIQAWRQRRNPQPKPPVSASAGISSSSCPLSPPQTEG